MASQTIGALGVTNESVDTVVFPSANRYGQRGNC
ncbi:MAG: hypothetical protein L6V93_18330 [Clostridiales bacterium]|nr:MAG: hypothetical protein L6V93_18330 [Clostridiales bacterium]